MLKLLSKDEISRKKNDDLRREADEGLRLSRKVDALRELHAENEKNTEKYLNASLAAAQEQIDTAIKKRDSLISEVSELQKKLDAMLPEMETTRAGLRKRELMLDKLQQDISEREESIKLAELDIAETLQSARHSLEISQLKENEAKQREKRASDNEIKARESLERANSIESHTIKEKERISEILSEREFDISKREHEMKEKIDRFEKDKLVFEQEKIRFADRKAMLERNLARLKNLRNERAEG